MKKLLLVICAMLSLNILTAQKNVLIEEFTGTWCTYCPSGIYHIDSLQHEYDNVITIAVHNGNDPMAYEEYANELNLLAAPSANIGRRYNDKAPIEWFEFVAAEMNQPSKSTVSVETTFDEATRLLTAVVTVTALENLTGDAWRISAVVTEDAVTGPAPYYNQQNIYATLYGYMGGYENLPNPIPASRIAYDHVARQLLGGYEGEAAFSTGLVAGQSYAQTFTYYIPEEYDHNYIRVVGILLGEGGIVDNAGISEYANGQDNAAPKFTSTPITENYAAVEYLYNIYVHDTDDKDLKIEVQAKPEWLNFEQYDRKSASIYGITDKEGEYEVVLSVSDGETITLQSYTIVVESPLGASWETLGERGFSTLGYNCQILGTCSYDGKIYMFMDESQFPAVYEYDSQENKWNKLVSPMDDMYYYDGGIAAGTDGIYITYALKSNSLIKVKKYADGQWSDVGNIGKLGYALKIAVDAENTVYLAFNDSGEGNHHFVNRYYNGNWENVGATYITATGGGRSKLTLDGNGTPYVSYYDQYQNKVFVSKLVGELWLQIGSGAVSDEIIGDNTKGYQDVAVDINNNVYVAYAAQGSNQLVVYRNDGSDWELLGDNLAGAPIKGIDVAIDSDQNFYVTFADGNYEDKVSVLKYDGTEWNFVGQRGFSESATDAYLSMTLHNDFPCVVYTDLAMSNKPSAKYYKLTDFLFPPYNLKTQLNGENVELTWEAPISAEPTKYNVYRNDALVGNTTQTSFVDEDLESGEYTYAVSAVYEDGESEKTTPVTVNVTLSVNENNEVVFMMYPNPAENHITIESTKDAEVKIYSVNGQMLSQQNISEGINTIDISNLNAGMYFVSVNGTMVKIVKN